MSQDQDRMLIELHVADMQDQCIVVYYTPAVVPWQILFGRRLVAEKCPLQGYTPQRYATTHRIEYRDILSDVTLGHFLWPAAVAFGLWVGARCLEGPDAALLTQRGHKRGSTQKMSDPVPRQTAVLLIVSAAFARRDPHARL